ncbi:MAG: protoporphyrinogen oxidase [Actinomycetales bacterium]|nr:protoporphyrinogen oxidase [Actinomycetales bacterium]
MSRGSVVVIGGGIAGLAAAWELSGGASGPTPGTPRIELLESRERVGGSLATTTFAERTIDLGPDGFLARRPEATTLVSELGWADQLEPIGASGASMYLRGALHEIPSGLALGVPTTYESVAAMRGLTWRARLASRRDLLWPRRLTVGDDAAIGTIVRTKLGSELAYQFVEPMVGGIQAGRIDDLSARSIFPSLLEAARRGGSLMKAMRPPAPAPTSGASATPLFYSLLGGVGSLPVELARQLEARGVRLRTSTAVTALRRVEGSFRFEVDTDTTTTPANVVVVATPAGTAAALAGSLDPDLAALGTIQNAGAAMVTIVVPRAAAHLPEHGTGVLVPLGTPWRGGGTMLVTALTFLDRKWAHLSRERDVILRAHVGRIDDHRWAELDDAALSARVVEEVRHILSPTGEPTATLVQRWPDGLPQYYVGHDELIDRARAAAGAAGIELAGSAYDGVGIPASIGSGRRAGAGALARLG